MTSASAKTPADLNVLAVKFVDGRGRVRWQPQDQYGRRRVITYSYGTPEGRAAWKSGKDDPYNARCLYSSRRRAERIARRKNRRDDKWDSSVFEEATND